MSEQDEEDFAQDTLTQAIENQLEAGEPAFVQAVLNKLCCVTTAPLTSPASNKACAPCPSCLSRQRKKSAYFCPAAIRLLAASDQSRLPVASLHCLSQAGCFQPIYRSGCCRRRPQLTKTRSWSTYGLYP
jgi:hypothetical protein